MCPYAAPPSPSSPSSEPPEPGPVSRMPRVLRGVRGQPPSADGDGDGDCDPEFVYAMSLMAALECATGRRGHSAVLPFLGMARAELSDFGQHGPSGYVAVTVGHLLAGLEELDERLAALLSASPDLQRTLRIHSARRLLRRGVRAAYGAPR